MSTEIAGATEIAGLLVTADAQTGDAERALDRLGIKYDQTVNRMRAGSGQFVGFADANKRAAAEAKRHADAIDTLRGKLQSGAQTATQLGVAITAGITLPILGATAAIIGLGTKTATSLNTLQAVTRATDAQMQQARATARALGADLSLPGTSAGDSALAMVELAKGGLTLEQAMRAARGTIQLARAATIGEAQAAIIAADALNTFKLGGDQAMRVADLLAGAANASSGEITDMAAALAQVGAVAKGAGLSIEDTATAVSLLARNGVKGSDAGTSLKTFLLALQSPISNDAQEMMKALGLAAFDLQGNFKPLPQLIGEFKTKLDGLNPEAQAKALREIFGQDAIRAARILFGEGTAGFAAMNTAITRQGSAAEIASAKAKGLVGAWEGLKSTLETFADDVFTDLEQPLTKLIAGITSGVQFLADAWNNMGTPAKTAIATLLGVAAAAGPVLIVVGTIASAVLGLAGSIASVATAVSAAGGLAAIGAIIAPALPVILAVAAGIAILAAEIVAAAFAIHTAWTTNWLGIRDLTRQAWGAIKTFVLDVWQELRAAYQLIMPEILTITRNVLGAVQAFWNAHGAKIVAVVKTAWEIVTTVIKTAIKLISSAVAGVLAVINGDWQKAWDMAVRFVEAFLVGLNTIFEKAQAALLQLVVFIIGKANQFVEAGKQLALKLVVGFITELWNGAPRIAAAMVGIAAMLATPAVLAAYAAAGVAQARARNQAFEANLKVQQTNANPFKENSGDDAEYVQPGSGYNLPPATGTAGGTTTKTTGLPGAPSTGGGGGERAASRRFKLEMQIAEVGVQTIERLNAKALADADYYYTQGNQLLDAYVAARKTAASKLFAAENERNNQEVRALQVSGITGRQRVLAEAEITEKVQATWQKYRTTIAEIDRQAAAERLAAQKTGAARSIELLQEVASGQQDVYQQMAEQGVLTFRQAQAAINGAQMEILLAQKTALERQRENMDAAGVDQQSEPYRELAHQIELALQRIENARAANSLGLQRATQRDADTLRSHQSQLTSIYAAIASMELQGERDRLRILEQMGLRKEIVWQREMELALKAEEADRTRRVAELERQRAYVAEFEQNEQRKAEIIKAINAQIEAEERAGAQQRANIVADFYEKHRQKLRDFADKIVGSFKSALDRYKEEGLKGFFKSLGDSFRQMLEQWALDLLRSRVLQLLQNIYKVPQVPASGGAPGAGAGAPSPPGGGGAAGLFGGLLQNFFGGGGQNNPALNQAGSITQAGRESVSAIQQAGEANTGAVDRTGRSTSSAIITAGQGMVGVMTQMLSMMANFGASGGFSWRGLLGAAAVGAINGAVGQVFSGGSGTTDLGGGSSYTPGGTGATRPRIVGRAAGGWVSGPGSATSDSILTALSNGEFVINAGAAARHRDLLEAINGGGAGVDFSGYYGGNFAAQVGNEHNSYAGRMGNAMSSFNPWGGNIAAASSVFNGYNGMYSGGGRPATPAPGAAAAFASTVAAPAQAALTSGLSSLAITRRASGGPVGFMPPRTSRGSGGPGGGITQNHFYLGGVHVHTPDAKGIERSRAQIERQMVGSLRSAGARLNA